MKKLTQKQIEDTYKKLQKYHKKYLLPHGVVLPSLKRANKYTKDALALVYLAYGYPKTKVISKAELTEFMQTHFPNMTDVQQGRMLAKQKGWYILSGRRNDNCSINIPNNHYYLESLEKYYPGFTKERREELFGGDYWENLKASYNNYCACCGSKEGYFHRYNKTVIVKLEKGHMDPSKPLEPGNIIPQCSSCNRADKNKWIYNKEGRVVGIANETVIDNCNETTKQAIYKRLSAKYNNSN